MEPFLQKNGYKDSLAKLKFSPCFNILYAYKYFLFHYQQKIIMCTNHSIAPNHGSLWSLAYNYCFNYYYHHMISSDASESPLWVWVWLCTYTQVEAWVLRALYLYIAEQNYLMHPKREQGKETRLTFLHFRLSSAITFSSFSTDVARNIIAPQFPEV